MSELKSLESPVLPRSSYYYYWYLYVRDYIAPHVPFFN
jgi:hypothetical protein